MGMVPLGLFFYFAGFIPQIAGGQSVYRVYDWVPSLGVSLNLNLDGLSMIFALMITGIGALVFFYTSHYLKGQAHLDRFYGYLSMFMASMLGLVLADNLLAIFVFWELTTVMSFYLIGYLNNDDKSRRAAMISLAVTGFGGMALFGGFLLLGFVAEDYSITALLRSGTDFTGDALYPMIVVLIFGGAFTKSAQFPFHFWLGRAMAAPTPVSTYLHSATMVKAGVYVLLRLTPVLGGDALWNETLMAVGAVTMVYAAVHTIFRTDLKSILAYSTVSALGILVFLAGLGTEKAFLAAIVFVMVHAIYKAGLFLVVGGIDKATGTREAPRLRGLAKYMWPVAIAGFLLALTNSGIPPTLGFVGKDLIYESTLGYDVTPWLLTGLSITTNAFLLYAGFVVGVRPFFGKRDPKESEPNPVHPLLWAPPLILAASGLFFGLFPATLQSTLVEPALAVFGGFEPIHLQLWHGFNLILLLSAVTIGVGLALYFIVRPSNAMAAIAKKVDFAAPESLIGVGTLAFMRIAQFWTRLFQNGYLRYYVITIMLFFIGITGYRLVLESNIYVDFQDLRHITIYEFGVLLIMIVSVLVTVFSKSRLTAVAAMGVLGYAICLVFIFYGAPDLAMTQFAIDTLTVILFVLVLYRLPRYLILSDIRSRWRDGIVSLAFGTLITLVSLEVLSSTTNRELSEYYAKNAYTLAHGKNVVNVILVDFRGTDTMVEITVLTIAAIGVYGLLKLHIKHR